MALKGLHGEATRRPGWRRGAILAAVFSLLAAWLTAQYTAPYVSLVGVMASSNGMPARNYVLTLQPTQVMFVGGTSVVVSGSTCATDANGQVVGMPNPLTAPITAQIYNTGTMPEANYYVKITWYDSYGHQTLPSVEAPVQLTSTGSIQISPPAVGAPANAVGMNIYIGTSSGAETYQGQTTSTVATFTQSTPITTNGSIPPIQNNTVCQAVANDAAWPIAGYNVTLTTAAGNTVPGFPQQWQLVGPGSAYNLSNGLPLYNGRVTYPVPVLTLPYNHNAQSISGPLSMTGYNVYNVGALGVGTALPAWGVDVEGTGAAGAINASRGYLVNGSGGTAAQCLGSDGTYWDTPIACITAANLPTLYYQTVESNGTALTQRPSINFSNKFILTDSGTPAVTNVDLAPDAYLALHKQVFTASGTFTVPVGTTTATVFKWTIVGAGGAGGGGSSGVSGSGGGAGATAYALESGYTAGNTITVTVGAGGVGAAGATGTAGGNSSISSGTQSITTVTGGGGGAGVGGNSPNANYGGLGGTPTNGDVDSTNGGDGATGISNSTSGGVSGGASSFGGGGRGFYGGTTGNGSNGEAWGSGGGGGSSNASAAGGNGAPGIVIVEWLQ